MATRSKRIFITIIEFADWLRDVVDDPSLNAFIYRGPSMPLEIWNGDDEDLVLSSRVYLSRDNPNLTMIRADKLRPGELGMVQVDVPRVKDQSLLISQMAAKSDWWDVEQSKVLENTESLRLYDSIWRRLRRQICFPVWVRNITTGAELPSRSIGYTAGAKEWFRSGGTLMQEGVANIRFEIRDP